MKKQARIALVLALAAIPVGAAQLYRWVDEKGSVEWRDTPPPVSAKGTVEQRNVGANTIQTSTLPYSVQQAVKNFPVTLWVFDCGETCTAARTHLVRRGVPFTERNAHKDGEALKKIMGNNDVPVLIVGATKLRGYLDTDWDSALDAAGYPRTPPPGVKSQAAAAPKSSAAPTGQTGTTGPTKAPAPAAAR